MASRRPPGADARGRARVHRVRRILPDVSAAPPVLAPTFIGAWVGSTSVCPPGSRPSPIPAPSKRPNSWFACCAITPLMKPTCSARITLSWSPDRYSLISMPWPASAIPSKPRSPGRDRNIRIWPAMPLPPFSAAGPFPNKSCRKRWAAACRTAALDHALGELGAKLRITRVDYNASEGSFWDVLYRWSPDAVREGIELSVGEALSALVSKYLDCVVAADQHELETMFGNFVSRSRVKDALNALQAAREVEFVRVGKHSLIQITPPKAAPVARTRPAPPAKPRPAKKVSGFPRPSRSKPGR